MIVPEAHRADATALVMAMVAAAGLVRIPEGDE